MGEHTSSYLLTYLRHWGPDNLFDVIDRKSEGPGDQDGQQLDCRQVGGETQ